jgi:hypothetical protein
MRLTGNCRPARVEWERFAALLVERFAVLLVELLGASVLGVSVLCASSTVDAVDAVDAVNCVSTASDMVDVWCFAVFVKVLVWCFLSTARTIMCQGFERRFLSAKLPAVVFVRF